MTEHTLPIDQARDRLADLVGNAAAGGGRTDVDDAEGQWIATVIGAGELAELEDLAAIGRCQIA